MLRWACTSGCGWNYRTCLVEVSCLHLEVLQWARSKGCSEAAGCGSLEVLQWVRSKGCYCDSETCLAAAGGGHLEVTQCEQLNDECRWDSKMCSNKKTRRLFYTMYMTSRAKIIGYYCC